MKTDLSRSVCDLKACRTPRVGVVSLQQNNLYKHLSPACGTVLSHNAYMMLNDSTVAYALTVINNSAYIFDGLSNNTVHNFTVVILFSKDGTRKFHKPVKTPLLQKVNRSFKYTSYTV